MTMRNRKRPPGFRLLHYCSRASLISVLIVALVIIFFYRYIVTSTIDRLGADIGTSMARAALISVEEVVVPYLDRVGQLKPDVRLSAGPELSLAQAMDKLIDGSGIVRIKIHSRDGIVVYSTTHEQIGDSEIDNSSFIKAIRGSVANRLIYHDLLNPFDRPSNDENLIQTYLPVFGEGSHQPIGVFEIYSDANDLIQGAKQTQILVIPIVMAVMLALHFYLRSVIGKANAVIERQQAAISERTYTLELLSAKLLNAQEDERKRLAERLHENIAQSLVAIKLGMDHREQTDSVAAKTRLRELIQDTIDQTHEFVMELRPPALDDFGATDALNSFLSTLGSSRDNLSLKWEFNLDETDLPGPLKTIVFRITQDTLNGLVRETEADRIRVRLARVGDKIELAISANTYVYDAGASAELPEAAFQPMRERTVLSGGEFRVSKNANGLTTNIAVWPV